MPCPPPTAPSTRSASAAARPCAASRTGLVQGQGRYTDDVCARRASCSGVRALTVMRMPHRRDRLDAARAPARRAWPSTPAPSWCRRRQARRWPTALPSAPDGSACATPPKRALAHEVVRYVGEAVAAVVADSRNRPRAPPPRRWRSTTEDLPVRDHAGRALARRAGAVRRRARQHRLPRCATATRRPAQAAFAQAAHRGDAGHGEPAAGRAADGAARRAGWLRLGRPR
jgi:carbon-monoxide dehydrogenase large subunit